MLTGIGVFYRVVVVYLTVVSLMNRILGEVGFGILTYPIIGAIGLPKLA